MNDIEKRARELLAALCNLPLQAGEEAEVALIIAAFTPPEGYVPESAVLAVATRLRRLASAASPLGRKAYIKAAEDIELTVSAARPEVP